VHIDHFEFRYDTMKIEIIISKFDTIQYKLNFLFRIFDTIRNISNFDTIQNMVEIKGEEETERKTETDICKHITPIYRKLCEQLSNTGQWLLI
jgi:hypothetical protein